MDKKLRILHVEDMLSDAELVHRALVKGHVEFDKIVVDTREEYIKALKEFSPEIILSDHALPSFSSHEALEIYHSMGLKIPFILVTGTMSDEFAVDIIKRGADDYVLKDRLKRLPIAIYSSLDKYRLIKEREASLDELVKNEKRYRALIENNTDSVVILDMNGRAVYASPSIQRVLGYSETETLDKNLLDLLHPEDKECFLKKIDECLAKPGVSIAGHNYRVKHKNGSWRWLESTITNLLNDNAINGIVNNFRDVTERKLAEEKIVHANRLYAFISQINQIIVHIKDEQNVFKEVCRIAIKVGKFSSAWIGMFDPKEKKINMVEGFGIQPEDFSKFASIYYGIDGPQFHALNLGTAYVSNNIQKEVGLDDWKKFAAERSYNSCMIVPVKKFGKIIGTFNVYSSEIDFFNITEIALLEEATADISFALEIFEKERLKALSDEALIQSEKLLRESQSNLRAVINNTDAYIYSLDTDFRYITFNQRLASSIKEAYGYEIKAGDVVFEFLNNINPEEADDWRQIYTKALSGVTMQFEREFKVNDGYAYTSFSIHPMLEKNTVIGLSCYALDITKKKLEEKHNKQITADLIQRNKDLEQFSYIVSHNLRAPVVNILGLTNLLIGGVVTGNDRQMTENHLHTATEQLDNVIKDLNNVLVVKREINEKKEKVIFSELIENIKSSIQNIIEKEHVEIHSDFSQADSILTLKGHLYSIFYNLISNSIKYSRPGIAPVIKVWSEKRGRFIILKFKDNGIGIDLDKHRDSIFGLYKRFHFEVEGKGMGLFMTKTQVETLGGKISIESGVNQGTEFRIELET